MGAIPSYSSIYALGHRELGDLFSGPVVVEEKVDGSQFSFMQTVGGEFVCRSKGKDQTDAPDKMFEAAVENVRELPLHPGWVYRGEVLNKRKHNALFYDRVPEKNVVIFDIDRGVEDYLTPDEKRAECARIGLECVPLMYIGTWPPRLLGQPFDSMEALNNLLACESFLGGPKIEGVVIKAYGLYGRDKKTIMGKYVSEAYKEVHRESWGAANPQSKDIIEQIGIGLHAEARWRKAIQHMEERGERTHAPQDIGPLLKEIKEDVLKEEEDAIKDALFRWAWQRITRIATAGFPEWYKLLLAEEGFTHEG
jgi:hypothetical protein